MNQSINTDSKNSKEPQQKYRLTSLFDDDSLRVGPKRPNHWGRNDMKMGSK